MYGCLHKAAEWYKDLVKLLWAVQSPDEMCFVWRTAKASTNASPKYFATAVSSLGMDSIGCRSGACHPPAKSGASGLWSKDGASAIDAILWPSRTKISLGDRGSGESAVALGLR